MRYVIGYDLNAPGKDYQRLYEALAGLNARRILFSQWVTNRTGTSATNLRDYLWPFMDRNDRIMVASLESSDWAGCNLMVDPSTV